MIYHVYLISTEVDIHGISMNIPSISHVYRSELHIHGIYVVYTTERHIPKIRVPCRSVMRTKALVGRNVSMQWTSPNGELLLSSRWNDLELEENKSLESLDNYDSGWTAFRQIALFAAALM